MTAHDFSFIAWPDLSTATQNGAPAGLVLGACEQHGAPLPFTTDTNMAQGLLSLGLESMQLRDVVTSGVLDDPRRATATRAGDCLKVSLPTASGWSKRGGRVMMSKARP